MLHRLPRYSRATALLHVLSIILLASGCSPVASSSITHHAGDYVLVNGARLWVEIDGQEDLAGFRRVRVFPHYDVTPEWVLHHLMQHEAEHRSQIGALRLEAEADLQAQ